MFKEVDILFFVEHKDRELEITREICKEIKAKNLGISIKVVSLIFHTFFCLIFYHPRLVITPSPAFGWGSVARIFNFIYGKKIKFLNLNYEQYVGEWESTLKLNWHKVSKENQYHICWHEEFKKKIISMKVNSNNIKTTHRPHDWLVLNKYKNLCEQKLKQSFSETCNIPLENKWFFIAMTDGIAFLSKNQIKEVINRGVPEDTFLRNISIVQKQILELIKWIVELQKDKAKDEISFILRPHPSVGKEGYLRFLAKNSIKLPNNLFIEKGFNATDWIFLCDYYITNYSTLMLDANILEKKAFFINPSNSPSPYKYWWLDGINQSRNFDEFKMHLLEDIEHDDKKKNKLIEQNNSIQQTSDLILEIIDSADKAYKANIFTFFKTISALGIFSKRIFGSLLRYFIVTQNILFTKRYIENLSYDFFKIEEY